MIRILIVFHDLIIFHIVVRNCLASEHYQCVFVNHVKTDEPYSSIYDSVKYDPRTPFDVKLLYGGAVSTRFISYGINIPMTKRTAIWSSHSLLQTRQSFLIHGIDFKLFTLFEVLTLQRTTNYVNEIFKLCYSKINSIIHHFSESFENFSGNIEQKNLRTRYISWPVELISFVASHDKNVTFINNYNFSLTYFFVENFKTGPLQPFEIIKCVLVQFREIKEFLRYGLALSVGTGATSSLTFIHRFQMLIFLLAHLQFIL